MIAGKIIIGSDSEGMAAEILKGHYVTESCAGAGPEV